MKIEFSGVEIGALDEGILRKNAKGLWFVETGEGLVPLSRLLEAYKNKEVRISVVDLQEAESLQPQDFYSAPEDDDS